MALSETVTVPNGPAETQPPLFVRPVNAQLRFTVIDAAQACAATASVNTAVIKEAFNLST